MASASHVDLKTCVSSDPCFTTNRESSTTSTVVTVFFPSTMWNGVESATQTFPPFFPEA